MKNLIALLKNNYDRIEYFRANCDGYLSGWLLRYLLLDTQKEIIRGRNEITEEEYTRYEALPVNDVRAQYNFIIARYNSRQKKQREANAIDLSDALDRKSA